VASIWFLFFSYRNDARSNKHQSNFVFDFISIIITFLHEAKIQQYRQCAYNVTVRRVRVATVTLEKQYALYTLSMCL